MYVCGYISFLRLDCLIDVNVFSGILCSIVCIESVCDVFFFFRRLY